MTETMALAKQFMEAVFVSHDSALAMSLVVPIDYVWLRYRENR